MVSGILSDAQMREEPYIYWKACLPLIGAGGASAGLLTGVGLSEQPTRSIAAAAANKIRI
jgi:hypothetical protein